MPTSSGGSPVLGPTDESYHREVYPLIAQPIPVFARTHNSPQRNHRALPAYFNDSLPKFASAVNATTSSNNNSTISHASQLEANTNRSSVENSMSEETSNSLNHYNQNGSIDRSHSHVARCSRSSRAANGSLASTLFNEDGYFVPAYGSQVQIQENDSQSREKQGSGTNRFKSLLNVTSQLGTVTNGSYIDEKALDLQDLSGEWIGNDNDGSNISKRKKYRRHKTAQSHEATKNMSKARYLMTEESREVWKPRLTFILLNNPYVPMTLRAIIFILTVISLALACSIYLHSRDAHPEPIAQQPSTIMAVIVETIALVYLVYITYDEYSGKPIGLREPKAKMRLMMPDLAFIIFSSANLSLAFNTLLDVTWTCQVGIDDLGNPFGDPLNAHICARQRGLTAFLFISLVMWVSTFTISLFRLVERVSG